MFDNNVQEKKFGLSRSSGQSGSSGRVTSWSEKSPNSGSEFKRSEFDSEFRWHKQDREK